MEQGCFIFRIGLYVDSWFITEIAIQEASSSGYIRCAVVDTNTLLAEGLHRL